MILLWPIVITIARLCLFPVFIKNDTPKYLYFSSRHPDEGYLKVKSALVRVYSPWSIEAVFKEQIASYEKERSEGQVSLTTILSKKYRRRLVSGCFVAFAQQMSGINFLILYSTALFDQIGGYGKTMTLVIGLTNVIGSIIVIMLIQRLGRKFNLVFGSFFQGVAFLLLFLGYKLDKLWILVVSVCLYMLAFAIGLGGTETAYIGEILPPLGVGIALAVQWIVTALIGQFLPNLLSYFGPSSLILFFGAFCFFLFFALDFLTIETKGKTEQMIVEEFENSTYKPMNFKSQVEDTLSPDLTHFKAAPTYSELSHK